MLTLEWTTVGGQTQVINFDASVTESYEGTAEASEHAVETGQAVTDYVRPNAETLTFEAFVTNTPIVSALSQMDGITGTEGSLDLTVGARHVAATVTQWTGVFDRVGAIDALLRGFVQGGQRLKVYTTLRVVENLALTRYAVRRDADSGNALDLTLELKRIRTASTARVQAPRRVRHTVNRGSQPATPAPPLESVSESLGIGRVLGLGSGG